MFDILTLSFLSDNEIVFTFCHQGGLNREHYLVVPRFSSWSFDLQPIATSKFKWNFVYFFGNKKTFSPAVFRYYYFAFGFCNILELGQVI